MTSPTPSYITGGASAEAEPAAIGSLTVMIYEMKPGGTQIQVEWPDGTKSGQPNLTATRTHLRQVLQQELDRAFNAWGSH